MKLSIWIIKDWLEDIVSEVHCRQGKMCIDSIRLFYPGCKAANDILYIGTSDVLLGGGGKNIVCKNQGDYLVLTQTDLAEVVNRVQDAWGYYNAWQNNCQNVIANDKSLDDLLALSTVLFPTPIVVVDAAQTIVAVSTPKADFQQRDDWQSSMKKGSVPEDSLRKFNLAHPDVYTYRHVFPVDPEYFFCKGYCKHIFLNGSRRASVILKSPDGDYSRGKLQLFDEYTEIIGAWITSCDSKGTQSFKVTSYFEKALEGDLDAAGAMTRQTDLFGWESNCPKAVFVIVPTRDNHQFDTQMISRLTSEAGGSYAIIHDKRIVVLINRDIIDHAVFNNALDSFLKRRACCAAASYSFSEMSMLAQAYKMAISTLSSNPTVPGVIYHSQDNSLRQIAKIVKNQSADTLLHPAVAILEAYDQKYKTDFYNTLFCYLKNERRHQAASEELFIHRNTLFQRLQKIEDIVSVDLENSNERFHLLFSFYQNYFTRD